MLEYVSLRQWSILQFRLLRVRFCESCPQSGTVVDNMCEAQDFLFELGTEDCKKRCVSDDEQIGNNKKFSADIEYR